MAEVRLSSADLWSILQSLSDVERKAVKDAIKNTRLEWLAEALWKIDPYNDEALREAYREHFPQGDPRLLRVYKRQLWDVLEEVLTTRRSPFIGEEVRLWQRLWLSVVLWQKGKSQISETLWRQAIALAVEKGWYEIALWGISLLENYARDLHRVIGSEKLSAWTEHLLYLISQRYTAFSEKFHALERYVVTRSPKGWPLPPLPGQDEWKLYLQDYTHLIQRAIDSDYETALSHLLSAIQKLENTPAFPTLYTKFHLLLQWTNLGILLLNLRAWNWYERWYEVWLTRWRKGKFLYSERSENLYRLCIALRIGYLIQRFEWRKLYALWQETRQDIERHIFDSSENIGFRLSTACAIYLTLLLNHSKEATNWRLKVEAWVEKEKIRDGEYLWWNFLRWYEAYRSAEKTWIRHWYRRLYQTWKRYFSHDTRWRPVLRFLRSLTESSVWTQRRWYHIILRRWRAFPAEKALWDNDSVIFPMPFFLQWAWQKVPLEDLPPPPLTSSSLNPEVENTLHCLLYSNMHESRVE